MVAARCFNWSGVVLPKALFLVTAAVLCLWPAVSAGLALLVGMLIGLSGKNPFPQAKKYTSQLLGICLVGLGAKLGLSQVAEVGASGFLYTILSLLGTFALGLGLAKALKIDSSIATLVISGTAICGGSAIAAIAPLLGADANRISISLATVFILNAVALYLFPPIGHWLSLSGNQFGLWGALAIHDTSSVVGAALAFGDGALEIATTVKLARAVWILPLAFAIFFFTRTQNSGSHKINTYPLIYVLGFIGMSALFTYIPILQPLAEPIGFGARRGMVLVLFLIGCSLSRETLRHVGVRTLVFGSVLWLVVAVSILVSVIEGWIV
jgi:uncharacterized integral membrane protein (TIGR00698 family)